MVDSQTCHALRPSGKECQGQLQAAFKLQAKDCSSQLEDALDCTWLCPQMLMDGLGMSWSMGSLFAFCWICALCRAARKQSHHEQGRELAYCATALCSLNSCSVSARFGRCRNLFRPLTIAIFLHMPASSSESVPSSNPSYCSDTCAFQCFFQTPFISDALRVTRIEASVRPQSMQNGKFMATRMLFVAFCGQDVCTFYLAKTKQPTALQSPVCSCRNCLS